MDRDTVINSMKNVPDIPYRILEHLATNEKAEDVWKMLKYPTYDCLSKPNLTIAEKMNMIWKAQERQQDYNVFLTRTVNTIQQEAKTTLKMFVYDILPVTKYRAIVAVEFDILTGSSIDIVEYHNIPCNRVTAFKSILLDVLNGASVDTVGYLEFNHELSRLCRSTMSLGNNQTFTGEYFIMGTTVVNLDETRC